MTNEEHRAQIELELVALKQEGEKLRNDLTRNMNALTLKIDIMASELKESQQKLSAKVDELTANVDRLTGRVPNLNEVAGLQSAQDGPIRPPETLPPPTA